MQRIVHPASWVFAVVILLGGTVPVAAAPDAATQARVAELYGRLPLTFEANQGQVDGAVRFLCRGQGYTVFLTPTEAVWSLRGAQRDTAVVRMQLVGGNDDPRVVGVDPQSMTSNYLLGNDPRHWHTGVAHYARVRAAGVYPGVDLIYRGNQRQLEYDFVIAPGADPERIRLAFRGVDAIRLGAQGELILQTANGDLVQHAPVVYQEWGERRQRIAGRYVLAGARREVGFAVGRYDRTRPLIIDPVVSYSTFLGGSSNDNGFGIAVDGAGNAYVTGHTLSPTFPGVSGSSIQPANAGIEDVFVTKINPTGTAIVYSTFLGGSAHDFGFGIAVDGAGHAYVTGGTNSTTFTGVTGSSIQPTNASNFFFDDAFVTKLNPAGTAIVYSTFLGGSESDIGFGIAADGAGNAYVVGETSSPTFPGVGGGSLQPAFGGGSDVFVTKIDPMGTAIVYSTFLGGTARDGGAAIAVDATGSAYVTGLTSSAIFPGVSGSSIQPARNGVRDAFVTKIDPTGTAIVYSTFLGGSFEDRGAGIAVDGAGNAHVTGVTHTNTGPPPGGASDAFATKINPGGTAIVYSLLVGGSGAETGNSIAVDGAGNAYVTGVTSSTTFPGVSGSSIQPAYGGGPSDAFVTKIDPGGAIVWSTFLGGSGIETGFAVAVDGAGSAYVTGKTSSTTFPGVSSSSLQPANGGFEDAFVIKISDQAVNAEVVIPTLSQWGSIAMALLLAALGLLSLRQRWQRA
jgi:hypothetical protein